MKVSRAYYGRRVREFLRQSPDEVLGIITSNSEFDVDLSQRAAWIKEIEILGSVLLGVDTGFVIFEYVIPRMGHRVDSIILLPHAIVLIEFKVGANSFDRSAIAQVEDYALDLKYFHEESHDKVILPVVVATQSTTSMNRNLNLSEDAVASPLCLATQDLATFIAAVAQFGDGQYVDPERWMKSPYKPTPSIVEAAQKLYRDHTVSDIARNDASAINLERTSGYVGQVIDYAKQTRSKHICLVTGVPGSGKTLAGLTIANSRQKFEEEEHAVFLSGNGPLVLVLQEALARDQYARGLSKSKAEALRQAKTFIQGVHHFRDGALSDDQPPHEKVVVFDEAQRAWSSNQLSKFMNTKRGIVGFDQSEPEFLIEVMDRHQDWAVIVCLVGEGQEIHTGEAGISEWLRALAERFGDWTIHSSPRITEKTYALDIASLQLIKELESGRVSLDESLHLSVSIRSFRSERLSAFVAQLLDNESEEASREFSSLSNQYPIAVTRDLDVARNWVKAHARGTERVGLIASSGAKRLRPSGVWVDYPSDPREWFLNDQFDVRSSNSLEIASTEFDVQGLEIDWSIVGWDGDLRHNGRIFESWSFKGNKWQSVLSEDRRSYLVNAYRVLLTRARQGMIIFIPEGDSEDPTRKPSYYDNTFNYLASLGLPVL